MGLRSALAKAAVGRCHVFLIEAYGGASSRMAAERYITDQGWVEALSPGDADILCVCGEVPEGQTEAVDRLWDQLPGPRSRTAVTRSEHIGNALDDCAKDLQDEERQRRLERERKRDPEGNDGGADAHMGMHHGGMDHGDMDDGGVSDENHPDTDHGDMDHGGMDQGDMDHGGMDHGDMDMPMPGGIALAGEGKDRDGLDLDVLKVHLGPYLPFWPAGLVLHCELQGDIVFAATAEYVFSQPGNGPMRGDAAPERVNFVRQADLVSRLLHLSGAAGEAARVRTVRDAAAAGVPMSECRQSLSASAGRLRRNWLLRRTLRALGRMNNGAEPAELGGTDVWDRLLGLADGAAAGSRASSADPRKVLPDLVRGMELSVVRLIVASFDLTPQSVAADGTKR